MPTSPALSTPTAPPAQSNLSTPTASPDTPEEAAQAFEKVLVRRFVKTMTDDMLNNPLSGKDGPGWMQGQRNQQRDILTDVLTDHLVEADALGLSDMLLEDWGLASGERGALPASDGSSPLPDRPPHIAAQIK